MSETLALTAVALEHRLAGNDVVVHDPMHERVHDVNKTAAHILRACNGQWSAQDIADDLSTRTGVSSARTLPDVERALVEFRALQLVHWHVYEDQDVVRVSGLTKSFPTDVSFVGWCMGRSQRWPVLCDIDFTIRRGKLFGLLGANGAGKSTLSRILVGLMIPDGGRVGDRRYRCALRPPRDAQPGRLLLGRGAQLLLPTDSAEKSRVFWCPSRATRFRTLTSRRGGRAHRRSRA